MATFFSNTINSDLSTDANAQAYWATLDTQITSLGGWSYVSQSGDQNPATIVTGATGTYPGFRIYSTTVGGVTWYMRIDFGHTSAGPSIKIQLGSGVNGSGVLTGQIGTQQTIINSSGTGGTNRSIWISAAVGRFAMMAMVGTTIIQTGTWVVSVHVDVDVTGAGTTTGIQLFAAHNNATFVSQPLPASGTIPAAGATWPSASLNLADGTIGAHVMTYHPFLWVEGGGLNVTAAVAEGGTTNFPTAGTTTTISLYSATRTFLLTAQVGGNLRALMLFD